MTKHIAWLGFGDLGQRFSSYVDAQVTGVRRCLADSPSGVRLLALDCRTSAAMDHLMRQPFDTLVMSFTPDQYDLLGYRQAYIDTLATVLTALDKSPHKPCLLWLSSTRVYGQNQGQWVSEQSQTLTNDARGQCLLAAELMLRASGYRYCIVRSAGIYGRKSKRAPQPARLPTYTNRIHADDLARAIAHLVRLPERADCYIASDCQPALDFDVAAWRTHGVLPKPLPNKVQAQGKRCDNQRLLATGFTFLYPSFRQGYAAGAG